EPASFDIPAGESGIGDADKGIRCARKASCAWRIAAYEGAARQIDIELPVLALESERPPKRSTFDTPEGVLVADPAGEDGSVGQMEISTARIVSVLEERLIIAGLAVSNTCAEMQDLRYAVGLAIDRCNKSACGECQIFIPCEAGKERLVLIGWSALAKNPPCQSKVLGIVHGAEADLPVDVPSIDKRCTLHVVDEAIAGFILECVEGLEIADSQEDGIVGKSETLVLEIGVFHPHHVVGEIDFEDVFPIVP